MLPSSFSYIELLSAGLFLRWNPEATFMVLIAYVDESGKDRASDHLVMAGYVGTANEWRCAEHRLVKLLDSNGINRFHAIELRQRKGEFKDWDETRQEAFEQELNVIASHCLPRGMGFAVFLNKQRYKDQYVGKWWPKKIRRDSQYGICFRFVLAQLIAYANYARKKHKVNVILEHGHHNYGGARDIFHDYKGGWLSEEKQVLGAINTAAKEDTPLLAFADTISHYNFRNALKLRQLGHWESFDPVKSSGASTVILEITDQQLKELRAGHPPRIDPAVWNRAGS